MAPPSVKQSAGRPCPASAAASTGAPLQVSVSRGSLARLTSASALATPPLTRATMGLPSPSATTTTCPAEAPHGTRVATPLSFQLPPSRPRVSFSPWRTGATVIGPMGTLSRLAERSHAPIMVSATGKGTAKRPVAESTSWASAHCPPAPPCASGICGRVSPFSSSCCQRAAGHVPFSADSMSVGVTSAVKSLVQVSARSVCVSCMGSTQAEAARDDSAQHLARAATEGEGWRVLDQVAEGALELRARGEMGLDAEEGVHHLGNLLLEARAHVLDHRGFQIRVLPRLEHHGDGERHLAEGGQMRGEPADGGRRTLPRLVPHLADQLDDELDRGEVALGPAPLEGELGGDLLPPVSFLAHQHVVGHEAVLEVHLVEVMPAREVDDGADADALRLEIDEELREPLVLLVGHHLGTEERDGVVGEMRVARPDLGAVDAVAPFHSLGAGADGGEVRARVRLAHADGEGELAPGDAGEEALALLLGAEAQEERAALPVGDPVGGGGGARGQRLLEDYVALQRRPLVAAVLLRPRHADEARLAELARELAVEAAPGERALGGAAAAQLAGEAIADLLADLLRLQGKLAQGEVEGGHGRVLLAEDRASDDHAVDFRGALADPAYSRLPVPTLQGELLAHPVAPVDLHGGVDDAAEHLARVELGDGGLDARVLAAVGLPRAFPNEPARGADLHHGVREHPLDGLALRERRPEGGALLGVLHGHPVGGHRHPEVAGGVREALLHEEIEGEVEPLPFLPHEVLGGNLAVLEDDIVGDGRGADDTNRLRGEAGRAALHDEAGDTGAPLGLVGAGPHEPPRRLVGARGEDLAPVQHPAVAALLGTGLDRPRGIGAARRLGDAEEGLVPVAHGGNGVLFDLRLAPRPDGGRRHAAEDAATGIVEAHAVLRHLLQRHAHAERVEPAAAVLLLGAQRPKARRLGLGGEARKILIGDVGSVGVERALERDDLVLDEASDLLAEQLELVGQRESLERGHGPRFYHLHDAANAPHPNLSPFRGRGNRTTPSPFVGEGWGEG